MKYLQIWLNVSSDKPSVELKTLMENVISFVETDDTYTLISNENLFPDNSKVTWIDSYKYIQEVIKDKTISTVWNYLNGKENEFMFKSDILRMYYLSKNQNVLYLDCDIELLDVPTFEDKFYLSQRGETSTNICMMYNGSDKISSMTILNDAIKTSYNIMEKDYSAIDILWILRRLRKYNFPVIDGSYFVHHLEL